MMILVESEENNLHFADKMRFSPPFISFEETVRDRKWLEKEKPNGLDVPSCLSIIGSGGQDEGLVQR